MSYTIFGYKAIPAEQRIREIVTGFDSVNREVVYDPHSMHDLFFKMVKSARHEIFLIIHTINAFLREERIGMIRLLKQENYIKIAFTNNGDFIVKGDKGRLAKILSSFVTNAIKFMQQGNIDISLGRLW